MHSIEKCKKILNKNDNDYSDVEVEKIRDFLDFITKIEYKNFSNSKKEDSTDVEPQKTQNDSESQ